MSTLSTYAWLAQLRERFGLGAADTADDTRLLRKLRTASAAIDRYTGRRFMPWSEALAVDYHSATRLPLPRDLLDLTALTNGDGSAFALSDVKLVGYGPIHTLAVDPGKVTFAYSTIPLRALTVTGVWGFHERYSLAWRASGDSLVSINGTATPNTITVANAAASDPAGEAPRFQAGQLLRSGSEYLNVLAVDTATNVLKVGRAAHGTTVSAAVSDALSIWIPPIDISEACLLIAAWLIRREDAGEAEQVTEKSVGGVGVGSGLPAQALALLDPYRRMSGAA